MAKIKTTATNSGREYYHRGVILTDGTFLYDGNWEAVDNDLYRYLGDPSQVKYQKETIPLGSYEIVAQF
jgi:hypothetical protein